MFPAMQHRKWVEVGFILMDTQSQPGSLGDHVLSSCSTRQQELDNLLHEKRYLRALGLAISLDRPHTVLTVIQGQCLPQEEGGGQGRLQGSRSPFLKFRLSSHSHPEGS